MFADVNKLIAEKINDEDRDVEDNEDSENDEDTHSAQEEQNGDDCESLIKGVVVQRKVVGIMRIRMLKLLSYHHLLKGVGVQGKSYIMETLKCDGYRDRQKCLHAMGFGSLIGMPLHELPGLLGFCVIKNLDTETNELSLTDSSIHVTSQSVHDILGIPIGGCSIDSLTPRTPDDLFIREWKSQFGEKSEIRPNGNKR
ncbi:hypothetical protein Tco_0644620 [Tanacetum coccineum]